MGVILASSVAVACERAGKNARRMLEEIIAPIGDEEIGISVITVVELTHGVVRADSASQRASRDQFVKELMNGVPVYPVTIPIALRAGHIDGATQARGIRIPLADLLIGATAIELGAQVATSNMRHFGLIPGLRVLPA